MSLYLDTSLMGSYQDANIVASLLYYDSVSAVGSATVTSPRSDHELARVLQGLL